MRRRLKKQTEREADEVDRRCSEQPPGEQTEPQPRRKRARVAPPRDPPALPAPPPISETTITTTPVTNEKEDEIRAINAQIEALQRRRQEISDEDTATNQTTIQKATAPEEQTITVDSIGRLIAALRPENKEHPLPNFGGNIVEWPNFAEKFRISTKNHNITPEENIKRLGSALHGAARDLVRHDLHDACFVEDIMERLERTFGGPDALFRAAVRCARDITPLDDRLTNMTSFTQQVIRIQHMINQSGDKSLGKQVYIMLTDQLPEQLSTSWSNIQRSMKEPAGLNDFTAWVKRMRAEHDETTLRRRHSGPSSSGKPTGRHHHREYRKEANHHANQNDNPYKWRWDNRKQRYDNKDRIRHQARDTKRHRPETPPRVMVTVTQRGRGETPAPKRTPSPQ